MPSLIHYPAACQINWQLHPPSEPGISVNSMFLSMEPLRNVKKRKGGGGKRGGGEEIKQREHVCFTSKMTRDDACQGNVGRGKKSFCKRVRQKGGGLEQVSEEGRNVQKYRGVTHFSLFFSFLSFFFFPLQSSAPSSLGTGYFVSGSQLFKIRVLEQCQKW